MTEDYLEIMRDASHQVTTGATSAIKLSRSNRPSPSSKPAAKLKTQDDVELHPDVERWIEK